MWATILLGALGNPAQSSANVACRELVATDPTDRAHLQSIKNQSSLMGQFNTKVTEARDAIGFKREGGNQVMMPDLRCCVVEGDPAQFGKSIGGSGATAGSIACDWVPSSVSCNRPSSEKKARDGTVFLCLPRVIEKVTVVQVPGAEGKPGKEGAPGKAGRTVEWLIMKGDPSSSSSGQEGDKWINENTGVVWDFRDSKWHQTKLVFGHGPSGPAGPSGPPGKPGTPGTPGTPNPGGAPDTGGGMGNNSASGADGAPGAAGAPGSQISTGTTVPTQETPGNDGDIYINKTTYQVYRRTGGNWVADFVLPSGAKGERGENGKTGDKGADGQKGADGKDGHSVWNDRGKPDGKKLPNAKEGELYIDTDTGSYYKKVGTGWELVFEPRAVSDQETLISGEGPPSSDRGREGWTYLDWKNGKIYRRGASGWTLSGDLPRGADIHYGTQDPPDASFGRNGDVYKNVNSGAEFKKESGKWELRYRPPGANAGGSGSAGTPGQPGAKGEDGKDGKDAQILAGAGSPVDAKLQDARPGALYIDTESKTFWQRVASGNGNTWTQLFTIPSGTAGAAGKAGTPGTPGTPGKAGADGATILTGDGDPSTSSQAAAAKAGDLYFDTKTGSFYKRGSNGWGSPIFTIPPARNGTNGTHGLSVYSGMGEPTGEDKPKNPQKDEIYIDLKSGTISKYDGKNWIKQISFQDMPRDRFYIDNGPPTAVLGAIGSTYLDRKTGTFYKKGDDGWREVYKDRVGTQITQGSGNPNDSAVQAVGESPVYINTQDGSFWFYDPGTSKWESKFSITKYFNGPTIFVGDTLPDAKVGRDGDMFTDKKGNRIYNRIGGKWELTIQGGNRWDKGTYRPTETKPFDPPIPGDRYTQKLTSGAVCDWVYYDGETKWASTNCPQSNVQIRFTPGNPDGCVPVPNAGSGGGIVGEIFNAGPIIEGLPPISGGGQVGFWSPSGPIPEDIGRGDRFGRPDRERFIGREIEVRGGGGCPSGGCCPPGGCGPTGIGLAAGVGMGLAGTYGYGATGGLGAYSFGMGGYPYFTPQGFGGYPSQYQQMPGGPFINGGWGGVQGGLYWNPMGNGGGFGTGGGWNPWSGGGGGRCIMIGCIPHCY